MNVSPRTDILSYGYALAVLAGGLAGYAKAGSVASLAAGVLFGGIAAFGAYQTSQNPRNVQVAVLASGVLLGVMGFRFYNSGKFMPAGLVAGLSLVQVVRMALQYKS